MSAEYANASIAVGAALVLTGVALGQKGMKALGVLLGSAGAMAAIAGLSNQWLAWFPSDRMMMGEASAALCAMQRKEENVHVNNLLQERKRFGLLSGTTVQKICPELSIEELKELCIKEFAEECGLDPNSLKRGDFDHIDPEVSEEIPDSVECHIFPNDEVSRQCNQRKECVEHYTKDFRTHLDKDMPLLQRGKDYSGFNVKGKSCTLEYTPKMRDSLNLLKCIKKFKSKTLPGCKDRFLDLKKYISVTGNECRLNIPSAVFESFKRECRKPAS